MQEIHFVRQKIKRLEGAKDLIIKVGLVSITVIIVIVIKIIIIIVQRNGCLIAMPSPNLRSP